MFFVGQSIVTSQTHGGGVLVGIDTGSIDMPPGQGGFASLITWTEARNGPKNVGGQIRLRGKANLAAGTTTGDYEGNVCRDR